MPFEWSSYLVLAKQLSAQGTEEANRSAISRAYYATFCTGRNHLRTKGLMPPETGEAHRWVWDRFLGARRDCKNLGVCGDRLLRRRWKADYDDEVANLAKETEQALLDADEFFSDLARFGEACP